MKTTTRRSVIAGAIALTLAVTGFAPAASASEEYPSKPITMLVGYGAGGQTDLVARATAKVMAEQLGQPINVVNKPGAGGALAARELQKASADGYTILFHANTVVNSAPFMMERVDFTPDDFEYAGMITSYQAGLVAPKSAPFNSLTEFVAWAKQNPGFAYGSLSPASRMYIERISEKEGLEANIVPLKSGAEMINGLLGGQIIMALSGGIHYRYPDDLKTISALTTFRHPSAPEVNTIEEDGYPVGMDSRTTIFLPKGASRAILDRLSVALKAAATDAQFIEITQKADIPIQYFGVDEAYAEMKASYAKNKEILTADK